MIRHRSLTGPERLALLGSLPPSRHPHLVSSSSHSGEDVVTMVEPADTPGEVPDQTVMVAIRFPPELRY